MPVFYNPNLQDILINEIGLNLNPGLNYSYQSVPEKWLKSCGETLPNDDFWNKTPFYKKSDFWNNDGTYKENAPFPSDSKFFIHNAYLRLGLVLKSYESSYNPIIARHDLEFSGPNDKKIVNLDVLNTNYVEIGHSCITSLVYINTELNTPPILVSKNELVVVMVKYRVSRLIVIPSEEGGLSIVEMTNDINYDRQGRSNYAWETNKD